MIRDLRLAVRRLSRSPGFTLPVVLCLGLAIGANSAVFSVVDTVLWRALPGRDPDRLVTVWARSGDKDRIPAAGGELVDYRQEAEIFEGVAASVRSTFNLIGQAEPERLTGARVSADFFPLLGIEASLGRTFRVHEDEDGQQHVVLLSHAVWQRRFGSSPAVLGKSLILNDETYTVVGVMPASAQLLFGQWPADLWVPLVIDRAKLEKRDVRALALVARLRPGSSREEAQAALEVVVHRLRREYPAVYSGDWHIDLISLREDLVGGFRRSLLVVFGTVGLVLLIACANVANLMLARAAARQKEVALHAALGASRHSVARQFLAESLLLALWSGAFGLLLGWWSLRALVLFDSVALPRLHEISMNWEGVLFTIAVAVVAGLGFGIVPALRGSKSRLQEMLKEDGRSSTVGIGGHRLRSALVVAELALALVVLVGAGLMVETFLRVSQVDPGFRPEHVLTFQVSLPRSRYSVAPQQAELARHLAEMLARIPGVERVGFATGLPLGELQLAIGTTIEGRPETSDELPFLPDWRPVGPGYFHTLSIPLLAGRDFASADQAGSPAVAIVDEILAKRAWPRESPLGKRIKLSRPGAEDGWTTVIGVVGNVRALGLDTSAGEQLYTPFAQTPLPYLSFALRTRSDPLQLAASCRQAIWSVDRELPIVAMASMEQVLEGSLTGRRVYALLISLFALVVLVLVALGVYGVMSYSVTQRRKELGIRLALGEQRGAMLRSVVGQGMTLAGLGVVVGSILAIWSSRYIASLLFGIAPSDLPTFLKAALGLTGLAFLATWLPAWQATRVDPVTALGRD